MNRRVPSFQIGDNGRWISDWSGTRPSAQPRPQGLLGIFQNGGSPAILKNNQKALGKRLAICLGYKEQFADCAAGPWGLREHGNHCGV